MEHIVHVLIGDAHTVADAVIKTSALLLTATVLFRFTERRTLAEFAPFDWIAAVASGAIVGRAATATDTSWLAATAALISLLLAHAAVARLRFMAAMQRFIDPISTGPPESAHHQPGLSCHFVFGRGLVRLNGSTQHRTFKRIRECCSSFPSIPVANGRDKSRQRCRQCFGLRRSIQPGYGAQNQL